MPYSQKDLFKGNCDLTKKDLYKILECLPDSSLAELKQAYHRKILQTHPDKIKNSSMDIQVFHDIKLAWEILGNPELRREYDVKYKQAKLEAEGELIYARLSRIDLEETIDEDIFSYPCRCGNNYLVNKNELEETNCIVHIPCQDCTFVIAIET